MLYMRAIILSSTYRYTHGCCHLTHAPIKILPVEIRPARTVPQVRASSLLPSLSVYHTREMQDIGPGRSCCRLKTAKQQATGAVHATGLRCVPPCKDCHHEPAQPRLPSGALCLGIDISGCSGSRLPSGITETPLAQLVGIRAPTSRPITGIVPQPSTILPRPQPSVGHAQTPSDVCALRLDGY